MRILSFVLSAFIVAGCASGSGGGAGAASTPSGSPPAAGASRGYVATLQGTNSTVTRLAGTVKLTPSGPGEFKAEVSIRNAGGMQNKYPWIIRSGQCGNMSAAELGNPVGYKTLETGSDGMARISATLKVQIPDGVYHVDILKSPTDRETVVACGVLSES